MEQGVRRRSWLTAAIAAMLCLPSPLVGQPGTSAITVQQPQPPPGTQSPRLPPRDRSGRPQESVAGTAVISGRVLDAETGEPLRRTSVQALLTTPPANRGPRAFSARTDESGAFVLRELPAGVYTVAAQRGGYVTQTYGQSTPTGPPRRLTIEDRGKVTGIDFKLQPGGVIAGRVTDDAGEPTDAVMVRVLRQQLVRGRQRYVPAGGRPALTDDLGNFRVYGLAPGEYILAADPAGGRMMMGSRVVDQDEQKVDTVTTYAPGTAAASDADRLRVVAGQVTSADIQLVAARVVTVSGRVADSTGKPLNSAMISLRSSEIDAGGLGGAMRPLAPDGSFSIPGVVPGAYTLSVAAMPRQPMTGPGAFAQLESANMPVVVGGEDIENLTVSTSPPSSASGRVIVEGDVTALQPSALRVFARPIDPEPMVFGATGQGTIEDNFTVQMVGLRGQQTLTVSGLPRGWWLKDVRVNGQNALDGFDFGQGRAWTGLELVVNSRPASIGGQVVSSDGKPTADYVVLAFPHDFESRPTLQIPGVAGLGAPDQHGGFVIENLRPGEHFVIAVAAGQAEASVLGDPDRLRELSQRADRITVREGEPYFLNLKLTEP